MTGIHQVSSDRIYVVDAQTFLLPNFTYDGAAPGKHQEARFIIIITVWNSYNSTFVV